MYNLTVVAAFAALIPAIRAAHVDPMQVLREELPTQVTIGLG